MSGQSSDLLPGKGIPPPWGFPPRFLFKPFPQKRPFPLFDQMGQLGWVNLGGGGRGYLNSWIGDHI